MSLITVNASYPRRFFSFLIDVFLIDLALLGPFATMLLSRVNASDPQGIYSAISSDPSLHQLVLVMGIFVLLIALCYFSLFEWLLSETPGMMILNLRRVGQDGSLAKCFLRNLFIIPVVPFQLLGIIDLLYLFYSSEGQRWTEYLTGSKVVMDVWYDKERSPGIAQRIGA